LPAPKAKRAGVILPHKPFLYTVDQVALLIGEHPTSFAEKYVFREGFDIGMRTPRQLRATNIEPEYQVDFAWRINEDELKRWLRFVGVGYRDDPI
jgi:hypothetical protein